MHTVGLPRTCLGFTNLLFFILGGVGFVICLWCTVNTEFFREVNYTVTKSSSVDIIAHFVNLELWLTPLTMILMPIAVLAMLTSCCGVLGAGCKVKCAIKSYIFLVTLLSFVSFWLFFVTGIYNIYTNNEKAKKYLQDSLREYYGQENDLITYVWDHIMIKYECCGVLSFVDFEGSNWQKANPKQLYPVQCCKLENVTALTPVSKDCTLSTNPLIQTYKDRGCFFELQSSISRNKGIIIFYIILIGFFYMVVALFAYCINRDEPLLGAMAGRFTDLLPSKVNEDVDKIMVVAPGGSYGDIGNMVYVEDQPKRVVKVVSAINPFQSYKLTPDMYAGDTIRSHTSFRH